MKAYPLSVQVSVDGSCFPNERMKSEDAGMVVYRDDRIEHTAVFRGSGEGAINRMEIAACIPRLPRDRACVCERYGREKSLAKKAGSVHIGSTW